MNMYMKICKIFTDSQLPWKMKILNVMWQTGYILATNSAKQFVDNHRGKNIP
jgi:hypothetical protein